MSTAVAEPKTKLNQLEQLKKFTKVVADTADFESIKDFKPQDATTNPSLVYAATQKQQYGYLLDQVLADVPGVAGPAPLLRRRCVLDRVLDPLRDDGAAEGGDAGSELALGAGFELARALARHAEAAADVGQR